MNERTLCILAIGAHADDLEFVCAGTLARYAKAGHQVTMATTTWCKYGSFEMGLDETSRVRHAEAAKSASIIGATYEALMIPDDTVDPYDAVQQRKMTQLIRETRPDVIITHSPTDYHTDHRNVPELVRWTGPVLGIREYETESEALDYNPALYFMDTANGRYFEPTEYVDITETIDTKLAMLNCFQSQIPYLKQYFGIDLLEQMRIMSRYRGIQAGVGYAEAFRRWHGMGWGNLTVQYLP